MEYQTVNALINGELVTLYPTHGCMTQVPNIHIEYTDRMTHPLAWGLRGMGYDAPFPDEKESSVYTRN